MRLRNDAFSSFDAQPAEVILNDDDGLEYL
jgi:hypothetical protein